MRPQNIPLCSLSLALFVSLGLSGTLSAQKAPNIAASSTKGSQERYFDYPRDGVNLGNGWNSLTGEKMSAVCVTFETEENTGQEKWEELHSVTDQYSLMNELEVSAEAEVKALGATASAKVKYATSTKINNEYSNFAVRAQVQNGARFLIPEKDSGVIGLTPRALALAKSDPIRFEQVCGDTYVSSLHGGAELDAVITFTTRSQEDHQSLETSFSGSGWGVEASASTTSKAEALRKSGQMKITYFQSGGSGEALATDQDGLNKLINGLPLSAANNPKFYQMGLKRYDALPDWPGNSSGWNNVAYADIASQYFKLNTLYVQSLDVLGNQNTYIFGEGITVPQFKQVSDQMQDLTKNIKLAAMKCLKSDGEDCKLPDQYRVSDYTFRAKMPVAHNSFQADVDLSISKAALAAAQVEMSKVNAEIATVPLCKASIDFPIPPCPDLKLKWINATVAVTNATVKLTQLQTAFPAALKTAIARTWLESVNSSRCTRNILDEGCISLADLDTYIARINRSNAPITAAVPQPPTGLNVKVN